MCRSSIPSAWPKRASNPASAASATLTTRSRRDDQWPVQGRSDPSARAMALVRGRRVLDARMGRLVQQPPAARTHRQHSARRSRGTLLHYARRAGQGSVTQTKMPPAIPARFTLNLVADRAGIPPFSNEEFSEIEAARHAAEAEVGRRLRFDWDWASTAFGDRQGIKCADIERDVGMDDWRPRYKWASQRVHSLF